MYMSSVQPSDTAVSSETASPFRRPTKDRVVQLKQVKKPRFCDITTEHVSQLVEKMDALVEQQVTLRAEPHRWL